MRSSRLRSALLGATLTSLVSASLLAAAPASAAVLNPDNEVNGGDYTITLDPTERSGNEGGNNALTWGPVEVNISTGCPQGYRDSSRTLIVTADGVETIASLNRNNANAALWGLQGNPIQLTGNHASNWLLLNETTLPSGLNRFVVTCEATRQVAGAGVGDAKYFVAFIEVDRAAFSWRVVDRPTTEPPVEKTETTTSVSVTGVTQNSATLTATVSPVEATGAVQFTQNGENIGAPVALVAGTATYSVSGLQPGTSYTFGARYAGDDDHEGSNGQAEPVTTEAAPTPDDQEDVDLGVNVPDETSTDPSGLTIAVVPGAVTLQGADQREQGSEWEATGELGNVTVNDDRRDAAGTPWSLSGSASAFTSGSNSIAATNLGWTPAKVDGPGTAGDAVAPGTGLAAAKPLASGAASGDANARTTVKADLLLKVPAGTPGGNYTSTLTLTLI
ncbi:Ig-like domain-containing protein [Microbacterium album]|uniref:Bacterial Ig-like domain-containing protein n=1 Tax=Microbacterium album TaxID=2053191 RepID=A0A917II00_9MICO|nr:Ig-like domain-containing protein [Microbacterium album]GGH49841.1 hypothetical protein GCM10010921_28200 [Microbacterium album]